MKRSLPSLGSTLSPLVLAAAIGLACMADTATVTAAMLGAVGN